MMRTRLITGAAGFIGSNLANYLGNKYPNDKLICLDKLGYASNPDFINVYHEFIIADINDRAAIKDILAKQHIDIIQHLAAESHVCNSVADPDSYIQNNINGTQSLLEACRQLKFKGRFVSISSDEVFGELSLTDPAFHEKTPYAPKSPYSASKAAADHIAKAYAHTYGLDVIVTNCSNNFGIHQHREKLIPKTIEALILNKPMTVYGQGSNIRDWLFVDDHCAALDIVAEKGIKGESYCIGGENELKNIDIIKLVHKLYNEITENDQTLNIVYTDGRPTDDTRYAINCSKLKGLGWEPSRNFEENLKNTIRWYINKYETFNTG